MTIAPLAEKLGLKIFPESLKSEFATDELGVVETASSSLVESIRNDTLSVRQIDSFVEDSLDLVPASARANVLAHLLSKKAWLLFRDGQEEEGLIEYDKALTVKEQPSTWALKGAALVQLDRLDEAFEAFQNAHSLRERFGPQKQAYLIDLFGGWSTAALLRGLSGILQEDIQEAKKGVDEYIHVLHRAKGDNLASAVLNLAVELPVSDDLRAALEELELMVRLLSINDPFEGWRELAKEITKVWPKGVSAVDAIREQRE